MGTRAAIYARQSVLNETDDRTYSVSCETQIGDCRKIADRRGRDVVAVFQDSGITAADPRIGRPGFDAMLKAIKAGEVDEVICAVQSRLARHPAIWSDFAETCHAAGVTVVIEHRDVDFDDPDEELRTGLTVLLDRREVRMVKKRVIRKMAELAEGGYKPAGPAGYGYELCVRSDKRKTLSVVESEAEIVREMARRVVDGEPLFAIARDLTDRGVPTRGGTAWRPSTIKRILTSPRIAGRRVHQGQDVGPATWPAIIDPALSAQLNRVLSDPRRKLSVKPQDTRMLTGIAECGKCGATLNHHVVRRDYGIGEMEKYRCRHCFGTLVSAARLEEFVRDKLIEAVDGEALRAAYAAQAAEDGTDALLDQLRRLDADLAALAADYGDGNLTRDEWQLARAGLLRRRQQTAAEVDRMAATRTSSEWMGRGLELRGLWDEMTVPEQRAAIQAVFARIIVNEAVRGVNRFDGRRVDVRYRV